MPSLRQLCYSLIGCPNGKPYCRRCISFKGDEVEHKPSYPKKAHVHLSCELSPEQKGTSMKDKFLYNKKRKHYSYIFKIRNGYCLNILLTTEAESKQKKHKKERIVKNIRLYRHPNKNGVVEVFIYNHPPYNDHESSFDEKILKWSWDINDKRKVKRMKKYRKYYGNKKSR